MRTLLLVLACASALGAQGSAHSDSAKAAAIVARHVAAVGGAPAFRALKNFHAVITMSMPGQTGGPEVRSEIYARHPNLMYMKMDLPGVGVMELGYDGATAWSISPAGPVIHDEVPKQLLDVMKFGDVPLSGVRVSYLGPREIGGRRYEAVRAVMPDSQRMTHYFDVETGLLAGMDPDGAPAPPPGRMTLSFQDYQRFGGILQPTRMTTIAQGQEMVARTVSLSHDPIDVRVFQLPAAVAQLRDKPPER